MGLGNWGKRVGVSGLSWVEIKRHYSLIPVYFLTGLGLAGAAGYVLRLATRHPEVSWTKGNPEPWQEYSNKQYKFLASGRDYTKPSPAPKYR